MRIVIIEDEELTAADLAATISRVQPDATIVAMLQSVKESIAYFRQPQQDADLIFSDIQLGDGTSFDIFSEVNITAPVVFCTAFDEYALNAFDANGIAYILKPFTDEMVLGALRKYHLLKGTAPAQPQPLKELLDLIANQKTEGQGAILVYHKDHILPIPVKEIAFFYSKNNTVHLTTLDKKSYTINKSLEELEKVAGSTFFRVNRQYLVNRKAVVNASSYSARKLSVSLMVPVEEDVIVSKEKMSLFLQWLTVI